MTNDSGTRRFDITGACEDIRDVAAQLEHLFEKLGLPNEQICCLSLAFDEAVSNAVKHGHCGDRSRKIRIECRWDASAITVVVADHGPGFDQGKVPNPTLRTNLMKESGRGLHIIASIMSAVSFNEKGNEIRMTLNRNAVC